MQQYQDTRYPHIIADAAAFDGASAPAPSLLVDEDGIGPFVLVRTRYGAVQARPGDWIVKRGPQYPFQVLPAAAFAGRYAAL